MTEQRVQRRLAAILAADVVGYSALMQRAEEATYAEFERLKRELIAPCLSRHEGRLIKTTGDGALAEFASPLAAIRCAVEIQEHLASGGSPLRLRVGLNLGDVIVGQDGDLYGDGINIAVRLEGIADPGGILISEKVYSEVEGKLDVGFEDRGEQQLKNISKPVRAYAVRAGAHSALTDRLSAAPPLPDKPSIAVLPFQNMSGDPEQEYFADGMVEDIITALSRFKALFVIARNSSFTYKGRAVDVKQVGRELGVRYVLEGSVRKAANRVRITGQLIDAATGAHLWADRFDGELEDIFDLQDQVTDERCRRHCAEGWSRPRSSAPSASRPRASMPTTIYLRGLARLYQYGNRKPTTEALRLFNSAIELDPDFALAYVGRHCYAMPKPTPGFQTQRTRLLKCRGWLKRALEHGKDDAVRAVRQRMGVGVCRSWTSASARPGRSRPYAQFQFGRGMALQWLDENLARRSGPGHRAFRTCHALNPLARGLGDIKVESRMRIFFWANTMKRSSWAAMALQNNPDSPGWSAYRRRKQCGGRSARGST